MTTNEIPTCCESPELWVTSGIVRCITCDTWMPEHRDSKPARPGLIWDNQFK